MSFIRTFSGLHFDPVEPDEERIRIGDVAHALSLLCRANGHVRHFYSVAQHSIVCAKEAEARGLNAKICFACLLHDASEAYLSDVTRPVKPNLPFYLAVEKRLQDRIWKRFLGEDLTEEERAIVFSIDDDVLSLEFHELMYEDISENWKKLAGSYILSPARDPEAVEREFLALAAKYAGSAEEQSDAPAGAAEEALENACLPRVTVRPYTEADLPDMIRIWNEVVEDGEAFPQEEPLDAESGKRFFAEQTLSAVAVIGKDAEATAGERSPASAGSGTVCGLYILHPNNVGRCGHICNASYAIASGMRGLHMGEALVKDCLDKAGKSGFTVLQFNAVVESNTHARHLYERLGFTPLGVIPKGFRMKDGHYENICPYYHLV